MQATLWIGEGEQRIAWRSLDVQTTGIAKPSAQLTFAVTAPFAWGATGITEPQIVARFALFMIEGFHPMCQAHYKLITAPPLGWCWIVHPTKPKLLLSRSLVTHSQ